jgi:hypothetical protein
MKKWMKLLSGVLMTMAVGLAPETFAPAYDLTDKFSIGAEISGAWIRRGWQNDNVLISYNVLFSGGLNITGKWYGQLTITARRLDRPFFRPGPSP